MKPLWKKLAARIDALSLRERVLVFAVLVGTIVFLSYFSGLGPMLGEYAKLRGQIRQQQNNLAGLDSEIMAKLQAFERDPDVADRARLAQVRAESAKLGEHLSAMQRGLVPPERVGPLLDTILRANGRLRLVSMKTLAVGSLNQDAPATPVPAAAAGPSPATVAAGASASASAILAAATAPGADKAAAAPVGSGPVAPKPGSLLYRHGVQITVRGNYLDMIDYMRALETLPTQLFWGSAQLEVDDYPSSRLTLTLYTLSLDSTWMKL